MSDVSLPDPCHPTHAEAARTLAATTPTATLATLGTRPAGFPYASLVEVALDALGRPLLLVSTLAVHTRNLIADGRASLLFAPPAESALAAARLTLVGTAARVPDGAIAAARERFLAVHPAAEQYVSFGDFAFWRIEVETLRFVAGFGRMGWVDGARWRDAVPDPLIDAAPGIVEHMNDDHADALEDYVRTATTLGRDAPIGSVRMTGVDRLGFGVAIELNDGTRHTARIAYPAPAETALAVRKVLVAMVQAARASLA